MFCCLISVFFFSIKTNLFPVSADGWVDGWVDGAFMLDGEELFVSFPVTRTPCSLNNMIIVENHPVTVVWHVWSVRNTRELLQK